MTNPPPDPKLIKDLTSAIEATGGTYRLLTAIEQTHVEQWREQHFPFARWGRIQWSAIPYHVCQKWTTKWNDLVDKFHDICDTEALGNPEVIIVWSNALRPALACTLNIVRDHAAIVFETDFDTWLLCPSQGWCIEVYHEGDLCFGKAVLSSTA